MVAKTLTFRGFRRDLAAPRRLWIVHMNPKMQPFTRGGQTLGQTLGQAVQRLNFASDKAAISSNKESSRLGTGSKTEFFLIG